MADYVFLTGIYLPKPGATGMCMHQIAKEAVRRNHNVLSICYDDGDTVKSFDGVNVQKVNVPNYMLDNSTDSVLQKKINYYSSVFGKLIHLSSYPLRSRKVVCAFIKALEKILLCSNSIIIIASVNPIEAVIAAEYIKKKYPEKVRIVYYCADTLSNEQGEEGILSLEYRTKCGIKWEKRLFKTFDLIMIMECHRHHYYNDVFSEYHNKMRVVNFPLLTPPMHTANIFQNKSINLVYTGTLYRVLRNPDFLISVLLEVAKKDKIKAHFLGGGDCDAILNNAKEVSFGAIEYLGMQNHATAMNYISSADILLSIGNVKSPMAPSKIYEYMATGKPIIHVYTYDKDPCLAPLRLYQNSLLLKEDSKELAIESVIQFIQNRRTISYDEVAKSFSTSTPAYTMDIIEKEFH